MKLLHYATVYLYPSYLYSYTSRCFTDRQTVQTDKHGSTHPRDAPLRDPSVAYYPSTGDGLNPPERLAEDCPKTSFAGMGEHAKHRQGKRTSVHRPRSPASAAARMGGGPRVQVVRGAAGRARGAGEEVLDGGRAVWRRRARA